MRLIHNVLFIVCMVLAVCTTARAQQDTTLAADRLNVPQDSLLVTPTDSVSLATDSVPKKNGLDAPVSYQATDSIVMTAGNWAYLFGEGDVKYQNIELQSELIEMNMDSSIVYAKCGCDSIGPYFGSPLFKA